MVILLIIDLSSPERRDLPSSHLYWKRKEMMGEEVFQLHVATPTYATGSSFLLVLNRVFYPCWCLTNWVDNHQINMGAFCSNGNQTKRQITRILD